MATVVAPIALLAPAVATPAALAGGAPAPRCRTSQLAVQLGSAQGAAGSIGQVVTFRNRSTSTCALRGSPGLQMLSSSGQRIRTRVKGSRATTVSAVPERLVPLRPRGTASFEAGWADETGFGQKKCPAASTVAVRPPGARNAIRVKWSLAPYGGSIPHLECGRIAVSPVYAGTGPYEPQRHQAHTAA